VRLSEIHASLIETLAFYALEPSSHSSTVPVTGTEMVRWCCSALEAGYDTPTLPIAAGFPYSATRAEVEPYFTRVLAELHIDLSDKHQLAKRLVVAIAHRIISGEISPDDAAELIHSRIVSPLEHPDYLMRWCYLWEGNSPEEQRGPTYYETLSQDRRNNLIRAEAELNTQGKFFGADE
jgi:hypothetical protein